MKLIWIIKWFLCSLFVAILSACYPVGGGVIIGGGNRDGHYDHPDQNPSYGLHSYWYYPDADVYFDIGSSFYFYLHGSSWQSTRQLPDHYASRLGNRVRIKMESDKPYNSHGEHKRKYRKKKGHYKEKRKKKHKDKDTNKGGWRAY